MVTSISPSPLGTVPIQVTVLGSSSSSTHRLSGSTPYFSQMPQSGHRPPYATMLCFNDIAAGADGSIL
jgi:hypothetical protein